MTLTSDFQRKIIVIRGLLHYKSEPGSTLGAKTAPRIVRSKNRVSVLVSYGGCLTGINTVEI